MVIVACVLTITFAVTTALSSRGEICEFCYWSHGYIYVVVAACYLPAGTIICCCLSCGFAVLHLHVNSSICRALLKFGPVFVLGFLSFWFSWLRPSIQFVVCLCIYDAFLTMVDLNHSALLADLAFSEKERTRLNGYSSLFAAAGSTSVFMSYYFWDKDNIVTFQTFCVCLAVFSLFGFVASTFTLRRYFESSDGSSLTKNGGER